jgi:hypothetical protein
MNTTVSAGTNWSLNADGVINFFGAEGRKFDETTWAINAFSDLWAQVPTGTLMPRILECIQDDIDAGNGEKIAQVQLGARQAVIFFLEGKLTSEHLENATGGEDFIDIPNVSIDADRNLTIRIFVKPENSVATADIDGNIMASRGVEGINWSLFDGTIDFFGARGMTVSEKTWAINAFGGEMWVQVAPDTMMPEIRGCIQADLEAGNAGKLAQVQLGARQAVVFFLEGKLTRKHLKHATETQEFIDIPNVSVDGRSLTVRILVSPKFSVATADSDGAIL